MSIDINEFANVSISVSPTGVSGGNFGILGFLTTDTDGAKAGKEISAAERSRAYTSMASVGGDWEASSETYKAAAAFYGQTPTPTDFVAMVNYRTAQKASLVGGGTPSVEELKNASWSNTVDSQLDLTIDGTVVSTGNINLGASSTYGDMAVEITNELIAGGAPVGTLCSHNGYQFVITGAATGSTLASITFCADSLGAIDLGLTQATAKLSQGINAETAADSLNNVIASGREFVGLVTHKMFRDASTAVAGDLPADIALIAFSNKKIFCNTTNDLTTLVTGSNNVAKAMKDLGYSYVLTSFSRDVNAYVSASVFGRAASVNFSAVSSTLTLNLKQMPGVTAEALTPSEFAALRSYNCSAVVQIGKTVNAYTDSKMASGTYLDTVHGLLWLENRAETDMFNLLYTTNTKIPYTQEGINTAVSTLTRSLSAAVRNGLCAPGFLPDGTYLPEGFVVHAVALADTPPSDKSNRVYNGLSFKMVGAGALHEVNVSGEFSE